MAGRPTLDGRRNGIAKVVTALHSSEVRRFSWIVRLSAEGSLWSFGVCVDGFDWDGSF